MQGSNMVFGLVMEDLKRKKYSSAMMRLTRISNQFSKDLSFLNLLARTQKAMGDSTAFIKTLKVIVGLTEAPDYMLELMQALYAAGELHEALDVGLTMEEMKLSPVYEKDLARVLVKIYLEFSDYEGIHEIAGRFQQDVVIVWSMGLVHLAHGEKAEALESFRRAVELNSASDQAWVSLAMLHEEMGDRELALANLERALDANPKNATGLKMMARWHRKEKEQVDQVLTKVRHYLSEHEFDEEISLCYMQILKDNCEWAGAGFEIEKLILNNPQKSEYRTLKKNLEDTMKL